MQEPYYWYVVFVKANTEHRVADNLARLFEFGKLPYPFDVFVPESEQYYRNKALRVLGNAYRKRPLFCGYVFIETEMPQDEFLRDVAPMLRTQTDVLRLLKYGESNEIALPQDERRRFEYLWKGKRCLERSIGVIAGDKVHIESGPLIGLEGNITHINRHNHSATVELNLFGGKITAKVALEIVAKTK